MGQLRVGLRTPMATRARAIDRESEIRDLNQGEQAMSTERPPLARVIYRLKRMFAEELSSVFPSLKCSQYLHQVSNFQLHSSLRSSVVHFTPSLFMPLLLSCRIIYPFSHQLVQPLPQFFK